MSKPEANSSRKYCKVLFKILLLFLMALSQIGGCGGGDGGGSQSTAVPNPVPPSETPKVAEPQHLGTWVGTDQGDSLINFQVEKKNPEDVTKINSTFIFTNFKCPNIYNIGALDIQVPVTDNKCTISGGDKNITYTINISFDSADECHGEWSATDIVCETTISGTFFAKKSACADDHGNNAQTAAPLSQTCNFIDGNIECLQDEDWFSFSAQAGHTYTIKTGEYLDTYIYLINSDGVSVISEDNDSGNYGINSQIVWTANASGTYYVKVRLENTIAGKYTLSILDGNQCGDDYGSSASDAKPIAIDLCTPTSGTIENDTDEDWFAVQLNSGITYVAETSGNLDTELILIDINGETELKKDDDGGPDLSSKLEFTVPVSGTYYLRLLQTNLLNTGGYTIKVCP